MKISGHVDLCGPELIEGWLYADDWHGEPIKLQVYLGSSLIGECVVDRYRPDLQEAGFGDGRCGFSFSVPQESAAVDFTSTRLRLVDTPVFLLPDEFSSIAGGTAVAGETESSVVPVRAGAAGEFAKPTSRRAFAVA